MNIDKTNIEKCAVSSEGQIYDDNLPKSKARPCIAATAYTREESSSNEPATKKFKACRVQANAFNLPMELVICICHHLGTKALCLFATNHFHRTLLIKTPELNQIHLGFKALKQAEVLFGKGIDSEWIEKIPIQNFLSIVERSPISVNSRNRLKRSIIMMAKQNKLIETQFTTFINRCASMDVNFAFSLIVGLKDEITKEYDCWLPMKALAEIHPYSKKDALQLMQEWKEQIVQSNNGKNYLLPYCVCFSAFDPHFAYAYANELDDPFDKALCLTAVAKAIASKNLAGAAEIIKEVTPFFKAYPNFLFDEGDGPSFLTSIAEWDLDLACRLAYECGDCTDLACAAVILSEHSIELIIKLLCDSLRAGNDHEDVAFKAKEAFNCFLERMMGKTAEEATGVREAVYRDLMLISENICVMEEGNESLKIPVHGSTYCLIHSYIWALYSKIGIKIQGTAFEYALHLSNIIALNDEGFDTLDLVTILANCTLALLESNEKSIDAIFKEYLFKLEDVCIEGFGGNDKSPIDSLARKICLQISAKNFEFAYRLANCIRDPKAKSNVILSLIFKEQNQARLYFHFRKRELFTSIEVPQDAKRSFINRFLLQFVISNIYDGREAEKIEYNASWNSSDDCTCAFEKEADMAGLFETLSSLQVKFGITLLQEIARLANRLNDSPLKLNILLWLAKQGLP